MKQFHIGDILSVTTGRLVSARHIDSVYEILSFLVGGESLWTHQLPRVMDECRPWLATQFPDLMKDSPRMVALLADLDARLSNRGDGRVEIACAEWVETVRAVFGLPVYVPVYEMGADMHTSIDPLTEAQAMFGDDKVIPVVMDGKD